MLKWKRHLKAESQLKLKKKPKRKYQIKIEESP